MKKGKLKKTVAFCLKILLTRSYNVLKLNLIGISLPWFKGFVNSKNYCPDEGGR